MKRNNGFALIELIVIIAIMGILMGAGIQIFGLTENGYVKNSAAHIRTVLEQAVVNAKSIAAKEWDVEIENDKVSLYKVTLDEEGNKVREEVRSEELSERVEISLQSDNLVLNEKITDTQSVTITFNKESGEVLRVKVGSEEKKISGNTGNLIMTCGTHTKKIEIYWTTGRIFME